jgi:hypothetical protein
VLPNKEPDGGTDFLWLRERISEHAGKEEHGSTDVQQPLERDWIAHDPEQTMGEKLAQDWIGFVDGPIRQAVRAQLTLACRSRNSVCGAYRGEFAAVRLGGFCRCRDIDVRQGYLTRCAVGGEIPQYVPGDSVILNSQLLSVTQNNRQGY